MRAGFREGDAAELAARGALEGVDGNRFINELLRVARRHDLSPDQLAIVANHLLRESHGGLAYRYPLIQGGNGSGVLPTGRGTNPVVELEVGPYGELARRSVGDGLTPDHSPSFAAILAREERIHGPLTPQEARALRDRTNAIVIRTDSHETASRTYGGRNTPQRIHQDSLNLAHGTVLDRHALRQRLIQDGHTPEAIDAAYRTLDDLNRQDGWY